MKLLVQMAKSALPPHTLNHTLDDAANNEDDAE